MPKAKGHSIKLGLFVSIGIALFTIGIYFIGDRQQLFSKTFLISGIFHDIGGLQVGDNVRFSGIDVGVVENIVQVSDSTVKVDMLINEEAKRFIKKNAVAMVGSDGLMGDKIVTISPGAFSSRTVHDHDHIQTAKAVNMDDILEKLMVTSDNAASITGDLSDILINIRDGKGTIGKLFMDSSFAMNVEQALLNIRQGTRGFKENMEAAGHNILFRRHLFQRKEDKEDKKEK